MTLAEQTAVRTQPGRAEIAAAVQAMPLERKIGQLLMVAFPGPALRSGLADFIIETGIGGVLLFADNIESPWQGRELTGALQACVAEAGLPPMLIAIDREGGSVSRLRYPCTRMPSPMAIAAGGEIPKATRVAEALAAELRELGLNLNLSAVVDVNTRAQNPVIGPRSYGEDPETVARFASAAIVAHHRHGVLVAAKHFPGHGDTTVDSHHELSAVEHDWSRLRRVELPPFVAAIAAGVDAVLTAHVAYPLIDPSGLPATLSSEILQHLLRIELGFAGLVISDAIEMNAIARRFGQVEGAVMAVAAGTDVVLTVGRQEEQREIHAALLRAARDGRLTAERVDEAVMRVLSAKTRLAGVAAKPLVEVGCWPKQGHQLLARQVARESITVVRDEGALLPLRLRATERLGLVEFRSRHSSPVEESDFLQLLDLLVRRRHGNTASLLVDTKFPAAASAAAEFAAGCEVLLVATRNATFDPLQAEVVRALLGLDKPAVVLALRSPYDVLRLPAATCYLASYGDQPCALEASVGALFGDFTPSGRLPVRISDQ